MTTENTLLTLKINMVEAEIRDLKKFWDDLSWWERDESMAAALGFLNIYHPKTPEKQRKSIKKNRDELQILTDLNAKTRPSKVKLMLSKLWPELTYDGYQKMNFRGCLATTMNLTNEEQIKLYTYLEVVNKETFNGDVKYWHELCWDVGANRTLAIFFALRNYLSRMQ